MKKILIFADSFTGYGAEHMQMWVGNGLSELGHEVCFCSVYDKDKNNYIINKSPFCSLNLERNRSGLYQYIIYYLLGVKRLVSLCKSYHFDYVITFKENPMTLVLLARLFCNICHIHSERDDPYYRDTFPSKIKMWLYRFTSIIVFQTTGARDFFSESIKHKSVIIHNPAIPSNTLWDYNKAEKTIVNIGRLDIKYKRQDLLIKAFDEVHTEFQDYRLVFVGDGEDRSYLENLACKLGIREKVDFCGKLPDASKSLSNAGIFVLTSDTEGIPNVLIEALAAGVPSVATDCSPGGAKLLIENYTNGLLVNRGDAHGLAEAIKYVLNNHDVQIYMSANAIQSIKRFAPEVIISKWNNLITRNLYER